ncbi:CmpA/NrtA family ABC transporter substrate-binding protein [Deinococcus roseus]|uniref:Nitrate transporter component, NrtA n=1 Tax=Deinococcus roseus TaxID=392414 RepID=A0ABQ2CZW0_9DEIO|nr:CmpA/NrtA family ABC transporter substrate-binding protein [Deinococcus roseus]GGJ37455.1 nitrate transporter component, NrtA [Deinococcus roseus]
MTRINRRQFIKAATVTAASAVPAVNFVKAQSKKIQLGFIALTDCASLVMAKELGYFEKYGVDVDIVKMASWAATRDALLTGDIQGAHCLFGMPFSVYNGIGGPAGKELPIAMMLNNNGQAITLESGFKGVGTDLKKVKDRVDGLIKSGKAPTFAMTFPGGTHDIWLRYWLAATEIDQSKVGIITIPPPQMVANMKVGNMDGFCVGEPWGGVAAQQGIGFTHITTQQIWKHHPEKALVLNKQFSERKDEVMAIMRAILDASAWLDNLANRRKAAAVIGASKYVNASAEVIQARLEGRYDMGEGIGTKQFLDDMMLFSRKGATNMPRHGHGVFFMAQYVRFGYLKKLPDVDKIAEKLILTDLYKQVAKDAGLKLPDDDMKPWTMTLDKAKFDPSKPEAYLKDHSI